MCFTMNNLNTETAYNCSQFPYLYSSFENTKNHAFCDGKSEYGIVGSFRIIILPGLTPKNIHFIMKNQNKKTAYNCR